MTQKCNILPDYLTTCSFDVKLRKTYLKSLIYSCIWLQSCSLVRTHGISQHNSICKTLRNIFDLGTHFQSGDISCDHALFDCAHAHH